MYVDTHIHLASEEYEDELDRILTESFESGVCALFSAAEDYENSKETLKISEAYPGRVYAIIGLHPWAATHSLEDLDRTVELIHGSASRIVGVGETGLDRKYAGDEESWWRQVRAFEEMIEASRSRGLPLVVHSGRSSRQVFEVLRMYGVRKALFHWFTGEEDVLIDVMDEGYYISFTPSLTYSRRLQRLASTCNLSQVLTETDGPVPFHGEFKGKLTVPSFVINVVEKLAEIHGKPLKEIEDEIARNCSDFFGVKLA